MCIRMKMLKSFIKFILFVSLLTSNVSAESFVNFNVIGNERVSTQTILILKLVVICQKMILTKP